MHAECDVEAAVTELVLYIRIRAKTFGFVEDDKLDIRYVGQKRCFDFADYPGDSRIGPVVLKAPNDSQSMTCVTDRREADEADSLRLYL